MGRVFKFIKKIIFSFILLYTYNKLTLPLNLIIPINILTVLLVSFLGIPAVLMIILFSLVCL